MLSRRSFFGKTVIGIAGFLGFEKFVKSEEPSQTTKSKHKYDYTISRSCNGVPSRKFFEKPNCTQTFDELVDCWLDELDNNGMCFTWVLPNALGHPMEMYCLSGVRLCPQTGNEYYPNGYYTYFYYPTTTTSNQLLTEINADWVMGIFYPLPTSTQTELFYQGKTLPQEAYISMNDYHNQLKLSRKQITLDTKLLFISQKVSHYFKKFYGKDFEINIYKNKES